MTTIIFWLISCYLVIIHAMSAIEIDSDDCMSVDGDDPGYCNNYCHQWEEYFTQSDSTNDSWFTHTENDVKLEGEPSELCKELGSFTNIVNWVLDDQFFYHLVDFTNAHAVATNDTTFVLVQRNESGILELKAWFVIYWKSAQLKLPIWNVFNMRNGQQGLNQLMSKNRFWDIHRHIKFADQTEMDLSNPRRHFDTLVNYIKNKVSQLWVPGDLYTIDEGQVKGKSKRDGFITFEPNKPDRSGRNNYKCCQVGNSSVGFTVTASLS